MKSRLPAVLAAALLAAGCVEMFQLNSSKPAAGSQAPETAVQQPPAAPNAPTGQAPNASIPEAKVEPKDPPTAPSTTIRPPETVIGTSGLERMVYLRWDPVLRGAIRGYHIYRRDKAKPGGVRIGTNNGRHATYYVDQKSLFNEVDYNTMYTYCVSSFGEDKGESACSNWVSATSAPVPAMVDEVKAFSNAPRVIPITWRAAGDSRVQGYAVFRAGLREGDYREIGRVPGRFATGFIDGANGTDLGTLDDLTTYYYKVTAYDRFGTFGQPSDPVSATTKPAPLPPVEVAVPQGGIRRARISWKKNTELDVSRYRIWRASVTPRDLQPVGLTERTDFEDVDLIPGGTYYYSVTALDDDGLQSVKSRPVETRTRPLPPTPTNLKVTAEQNLGGQIRLEWNARGLEPNPRLTFIIERQIPIFGGFGTWTAHEIGVETLYFVDRAIEPGKSKTYRYRVIAVDYAGQKSPPTEAVEVSIK